MENTHSTKLEKVTKPLNESFSQSFAGDKQTPLAKFSILENSPSSKYISEDISSNYKSSFTYEKSKELVNDIGYSNYSRTSLHKKYESIEMPRTMLNKSPNMNSNESNNFGSYRDKTRDLLNNLTVDDLTLKVNQERRRLIDDEIEKRIKEDIEKRERSKTKSRSPFKTSLQE